MESCEERLKQKIKTSPAGAYFLYGEETYLIEQYVKMIVRATVEDENNAFDLHRLDGQGLTLSQLEEITEPLPMMAEYTCVLIRDFDASGMDEDELCGMIDRLPDTCALVFAQMTLQPDRKKIWQSLIKHVNQIGVAVNLERRTADEIARMLVSGAKRRGCSMEAGTARYLTEQAGDDLQLLIRELDKLSALADGNEITKDMVDRIGTKNLEAKVFDLSKTILQGQYEKAYFLMHQLLTQREEPLAILGALSTSFCDIYRAKVTMQAGQPATVLAEDFKSYKGKEFRLRYAGRDGERLSTEILRDCLERLAKTDTALKSGSEPSVLLEETVTALIERIKRGK